MIVHKNNHINEINLRRQLYTTMAGIRQFVDYPFSKMSGLLISMYITGIKIFLLVIYFVINYCIRTYFLYLGCN